MFHEEISTWHHIGVSGAVYWFEGHGWGGPSPFASGVNQVVDHFERDGMYYHAYFGSMVNLERNGDIDMHQGDTYMRLDTQGRVVFKDDFTMSHSANQAMDLGTQGIAYTFAVSDGEQYIVGHKYDQDEPTVRRQIWPPDSMLEFPRNANSEWDFTNSAGELWDVKNTQDGFYAMVGSTRTVPIGYKNLDMVMLHLNENMSVSNSCWITNTPDISERRTCPC